MKRIFLLCSIITLMSCQSGPSFKEAMQNQVITSHNKEMQMIDKYALESEQLGYNLAITQMATMLLDSNPELVKQLYTLKDKPYNKARIMREIAESVQK